MFGPLFGTLGDDGIGVAARQFLQVVELPLEGSDAERVEEVGDEAKTEQASKVKATRGVSRGGIGQDTLGLEQCGGV